jgi:four helix bundle protein
MVTATSFEDSEVWKLSMSLTIDIYKYFMECKDWRFRDQIQRASVSVPLNISEGFARRTNCDFYKILE